MLYEVITISGSLPVIGEDDQLILGAGRMTQHAHDFTDPFVDIAQTFQCRLRTGPEVVPQFVVTTVGRINIRHAGIDVGNYSA